GVFEVVSTSGDTRLGGSDMDEKIVDWLVDGFQKKEGLDLSGDLQAMQRLRDAAEKAKIELTSTVSTTINLPFIASKDDKPSHLEMALTRAKLEELVGPVLNRCEEPIRKAFQDGKLKYEEIGKVILVGGPTRMPVVREKFEGIIGKKAERGVDPMQCVAMGAAIQGGILAGEVTDLLLLDVTPLSLGVETLGGVMTRLIDRNTTIPTKKSQIFTTAADGQTSVEIHALQGERDMSKDNITLGRFNLIGIPPAPRGIPQIEVSFDIDENGIMNVSAKDMGTGKEQQITITASTKLRQEEIDRMVGDAEESAEDDKKQREIVETKNAADSLIYSSEKTLEELGDQISEDTKKSVKEKMDDLQKALEADDIALVKEKMEVLTKEVQKIGAEIYQKAAAAQQAPTSEEPREEKDGDEKIRDAEYEIVDEE
ncbi:MAG: Hsp70 family protein, partial [Thermoplasmata archaeon]|nr:Hsp70 family protein [Thermoplasmata archaeon]